MVQGVCDHIVGTLYINHCLNFGPYNELDSENPKQRAYGTMLTSPNLLKQHPTTSTSFVRSSYETEYFQGKCFTLRLENKTEERELGKSFSICFNRTYYSGLYRILRCMRPHQSRQHSSIYTALCSSHSEEYTH